MSGPPSPVRRSSRSSTQRLPPHRCRSPIVARASDVATRDAIVAAAGAVEEPLSVALPPAVAAEQPLPADALRSDELLALPGGGSRPLGDRRHRRVGDLHRRLLREGEDLLSAASPLAVVSRAVWLADRPISAPAAAMLRDLGIRMLLVTDDVAAGLGVDPAANVFRVDLGAGATLPAMTVDGRGAALAAGAAGGGSRPRSARRPPAGRAAPCPQRRRRLRPRPRRARSGRARRGGPSPPGSIRRRAARHEHRVVVASARCRRSGVGERRTGDRPPVRCRRRPAGADSRASTRCATGQATRRRC